jgi:hypothetical protein
MIGIHIGFVMTWGWHLCHQNTFVFSVYRGCSFIYSHDIPIGSPICLTYVFSIQSPFFQG